MEVRERAVQRARRRPLVGAQVRRLRTDQGLTLAEIGARTGLNRGYLSQVETDKVSPSLETLAAIADALAVPITWLLGDIASPPRVVRRHERRVSVRPDGARFEEVDGGFARSLRILEAGGPPGTGTGLISDAGEEHHLVLEGRIRLRQGDFVVDLEAGDYLVWDGSFPHEAENVGDCPARILVVTPGPIGVVAVTPGPAGVALMRDRSPRGGDPAAIGDQGGRDAAGTGPAEATEPDGP